MNIDTAKSDHEFLGAFKLPKNAETVSITYYPGSSEFVLSILSSELEIVYQKVYYLQRD